MAKKIFIGTADPIAKVVTITVGGTLAGETFEIKMGNVVMASHTDTDTVISTTVAALVLAFNNSTVPWATAVSAGDSSPDVVLTAKTKGVDFAVTLNVPGGIATFVQATTQANKGPNDMSDGNNWLNTSDRSVGAIPAVGDEAHVADNLVNICWGLAITCDDLHISQSNLGRIGLDVNAFATSPDGITVNRSEMEYRDTYLKCTVTGDILVGDQHESLLAGAGRIMLDTGTTEVQIHVLHTAPASIDVGKPTLRLLANNALTDIFTRGGSVGVAVDEEGETSLIGDVICMGRGFTGRGVTMTSWQQESGVGRINAAADVPTVKCNGGTLTTEGVYGITTLTNEGGTCHCNNRKASGDSVTTMNANGGVVDGRGNPEKRVWGVVNHRIDEAVLLFNDFVTITTLNPVGRGGPKV